MIMQSILLSQVIWSMPLLCLCQAVINSTMLRFDPPNVIVIEENNATLTCNISNSGPGVYYIFANNQTSNVYHPQDNCRVTGQLTNTQKYHVRCINEDVQITIINVSRDRHGEVWTCYRNMDGHLYSSNSTVTVNVPITNLRFEGVEECIITQENAQVRFVCITSAGYPIATIRWYKNNTVLSNVDVSTTSTTSDKYLKVVRSNVTMYLTRADNSSQIHCAANNEGTTWLYSTRKAVLVCFPPDIPIITKGTNQVKEELKVIEGNVLDAICTTSSFPEPIYSWIKQNVSNIVGRRLLMTNITRHEGGRYTCKATNTMTLSSGQTYPGENSTSIHIHILYPPKQPIIKYSKTNSSKQYDIPDNLLFAVRNDSFTLSCNSESLPPSTYQWTGHQKIHGTVNQQLNMVSIQQDTYLTCTATNVMNETFEIISIGSASTLITIIVQHTPSAAVIRIQTLMDGETISKYNHTVYVIEGDSVSMICEADGKPQPYIYSWSGPIDSLSLTSKLTLRNVTRQRTGIYLCLAKNIINRTFGDRVEGNTTAYIEIVLASKPQAPTDFRYIEELTTDSSVTLTWKPGFSWGLTQTFILKYRKINLDHSWTTMKVLHTEEPVMTATLNSLTSGVVYKISLTARNQLGETTTNMVIYANTKPGPPKDKSVTSSINNTPIIVGGLVGSAIFIAGVCLCVWILRKCKSEETNQTDKAVLNEPRDSTYDKICSAYNPETVTAETYSRGSSATTSASRYEDLEMSTVGNDAEKKYQSLKDEETTVEYVNLKI